MEELYSYETNLHHELTAPNYSMQPEARPLFIK